MAPSAQDAFSYALASNQEWCSQRAETDPEFFAKSAQGQEPKILWIGCADSRVPETTVLNLQPGEVFTHRNIANILHPNDLSSLAVIEFSVGNLKVQHVVVCGHTSCGGVIAALGNDKLGILDPWLQPMRALRLKHSEELDKLEGAKKTRRLAELNVAQSLDVLKKNPTIIEAVKSRGLQLHGVIYDLASGKLDIVDDEEHEGDKLKRLEAFDLSPQQVNGNKRPRTD